MALRQSGQKLLGLALGGPYRASASSTLFGARTFAQPAHEEADAHKPGQAVLSPAQLSGAPKLKEPKFNEQSNRYPGGYVAPHTGLQAAQDALSTKEYGYSVHVYSPEYLESVHPTHKTPETWHDKLAYASVQALRKAYDMATGYSTGKMTEKKWLQRMIFLETVAGVPGMVGGMLRHLRSLRLMEKDHGWINTLLEEAENERMHLMTFMTMAKPGWLFRSVVLMAQGILFNAFFVVYLLSPKLAHSLVGYIEEEAVKTYTHALKCIDEKQVFGAVSPPRIAIDYWRLPENATMRDLILVIRADEACHGHVNHTLSKLKPSDPNPFAAGKSMLP